MTPANYTPGPWHATWIETNKRCRTGEWAIFPKTGCPVVGYHSTSKTRQNKADAELAAAAPELLEVCQWALNTLRDAVACPDGCPEDLETALVSAIAKAEGR